MCDRYHSQPAAKAYFCAVKKLKDKISPFKMEKSQKHPVQGRAWSYTVYTGNYYKQIPVFSHGVKNSYYYTYSRSGHKTSCKRKSHPVKIIKYSAAEKSRCIYGRESMKSGAAQHSQSAADKTREKCNSENNKQIRYMPPP